MTFGAPDPNRRTIRPGRSRARTLVPLAVAAWAVLEIWLLTVVAEAAGGFTVLLLLLAGFVLGGAAVKRAGRRAWRTLATSVRAGSPEPGEETTGAGLAMLGGVLLMVPGLLSDVLGLLCLFPPTGRLMGRASARLLRGRRLQYAPGSFGGAYQQARMRWPDGKVVQGEVIREDEPAGEPASSPDGASRPPLTP